MQFTCFHFLQLTMQFSLQYGGIHMPPYCRVVTMFSLPHSALKNLNTVLPPGELHCNISQFPKVFRRFHRVIAVYIPIYSIYDEIMHSMLRITVFNNHRQIKCFFFFCAMPLKHHQFTNSKQLKSLTLHWYVNV